MERLQNVVIAPGLGPKTWYGYIEKAASNWKNKGLDPIVFQSNWHDPEKFENKLDRLLDLIETTGTRRLVGISAGSSLTLNALYFRNERIDSVGLVCGRIKVGSYGGFDSFEERTKSSPAFAESIIAADRNAINLNREARSKILAMRAIFDELVPGDLATLEGAKNVLFPTVEHFFSIGMILLASKKLTDFLK